MQVKKIKEIANVSLGYSFRGSIKRSENGNMLVVQAHNVKDVFYIDNTSDLVKIDHLIYEDRLVKKNDIILSSRGYFQASVSKIEENMIASSSVYVIKSIHTDTIIPEYLALYLNSRKGQYLLQRNQTGSMVKVILKSDLEDLEIPIPSVEHQKILIDSFNLLKETESLLNRRKKLLSENFKGLFNHVTYQK